MSETIGHGEAGMPGLPAECPQTRERSISMYLEVFRDMFYSLTNFAEGFCALSSKPKILIIDDDPTHLKIYGLMVNHAGYEALPALADRLGIQLPSRETVHLVLLDYKLNCVKTPLEIAKDIELAYPTAPIVLLSDVWGLPEDIAPFVMDFVRKGEPAKLIATLKRLLPPANP